MLVRDKQESYLMIKKLNLNITNEVLFTTGQIKEAQDYLDNNPWRYYVIRDKKNVNGKYLYKLTKKEVLEHINDYELFSLAESSYNFEAHRILCGDIQIDYDYNVLASIDDDYTKPFRDCENDSKYRLNFNLLYDYEPNIKGLRSVIDYLYKHELFGMVVEFSLYDIPVGINKENIIIWELRNY